MLLSTSWKRYYWVQITSPWEGQTGTVMESLSHDTLWDSGLILATNFRGRRPTPRKESPHPNSSAQTLFSDRSLWRKKIFFFCRGVGTTTAYMSLMLLISSGLILLELFYTYQQTKTKGTSCQNNCKVFAEHMADCSASLCLSCQSNTIIFECKGRHGSRPKMRHSWGQSGTGQPASTQTISIWGKFSCRNWWVLDMAVGYTTEGSVCRQVGHLGILPQHGVQINRDYNDKKDNNKKRCHWNITIFFH